MHESEDEGKRRIGPHPIAILGYHIRQIVVAFTLFLFPCYEAMLRTAWNMEDVERWVVGTLHIGPTLGTSVSRCGLFWIILALAWSFVVYKYRNYYLEKTALIVEDGIFSQKCDTVRYEMVYDCDIQRVMGEKAMGTGTLIIRLVNLKSGHADSRVSLSWVSNPEEIRDYILSRAPKLRAVASF